MLIVRRRGWELPESAATPEAMALNRRAVLAGSAALALGGPALLPDAARAAEAGGAAPRNPKYDGGRPLSAEKDATTYNNYYEFSEQKDLWEAAQALPQRPWTIRLDGMVKQPRTIDIDDLLKQVTLEERVYRHRCVEAWAMTVPWTGFPLAKLVALAEPLGSAKFVVFETDADKKVMPGLRRSFYPFPYTEAVTMEEAGNELAFISTGLYGKKLPPQNGGPIRLTLPWKYGFKSAKSLVKISFTDKRPTTFWEALGPSEYGFWANVNPAVPHPRWSQASERLLTSGERVPTQIFNGYGPFVAALYADKGSEKLFM
ncbi:MAG TPA: protein-methionine-sulfoxide reductase catalytic subunit MsrP [Acetobacteraceae bacterium]|nr:protein-methionine-sulfoxide reductase catalytic subunit MsrP [Acetobacteraceae bacterium]